MKKIMTKEYQQQLLTLFGTVIIQGLMVVAVKVLKDAALEIKLPKKGTTYRVQNGEDLGEFDDIMGEDKFPKGDTNIPRDNKRPKRRE